MHANSAIYDDTDIDQLESLPPTQIHRNVDTALVEADQEGIVSPPFFVFGILYINISGQAMSRAI